MCARLLACPLCSQPGFLNLDAMRAGLVSVATRPLACPVCNEVLLGIDKLTIHLFGHTIPGPPPTAQQQTPREHPKIIEVRNAQTIPWNVLNHVDKRQDEAPTANSIYIPIEDLEAFRNIATIKDNIIPVNNGQAVGADLKAPSQLIFLQNVSTTQPAKIFSANLVNQTDHHESQQQQFAPGIYQAIPTSNAASPPAVVATVTTASVVDDTQQSNNCSDPNEPIRSDVVITVNSVVDKVTGKESFTQTGSWMEKGNCFENSSASSSPASVAAPSTDYPPSHTDRLADLVKNAQITASPLGTFHEAFDCSKPESPPPPQPPPLPQTPTDPASQKPRLKSTRILSADEHTERCNICGFHFPDRNILVLHKQLVHTVQEKDANVPPEDLMKNYPCHLCTKVFKMRGSLMVHMRVAHPSINVVCTTRKESMEQEKQAADQASDYADPEGGYNCPTCGKNFKKEQLVVQHLKIHDGKQWECDVCSKMFTTKYFLKKHKRLHSGEMPYKCNLCDKTFTFQQSFHKHRLYHKDDKPHTCTTCNRSFKELSTLHNHERIHTGEKPFACETCGKCFRQRVSYLVHRRIHTGVMPYKCTACGKTFRYKVSQRTHKCSQQPPGVVVQQAGLFSQNLQMMSEANNNQESSLQTDQSMETPSVNEENQYVSMNTESQNLLNNKSETESTNEQCVNKSNIDLNEKNSNDSDSFIQNIWNQDSPSQMEYKENNSKSAETVSDSVKNINLWNETSNSKDNSENSISNQFNGKNINNEFTNNLWNETSTHGTSDKNSSNKNQLNNSNDFFCMVMSPLENGVSSPSTEMEHLRLSSPVNNQQNSNTEINDCFSSMNNNSPNPVRINCNDAEESFCHNNSSNLSTLQTINEDSLKELLYSIVDK